MKLYHAAASPFVRMTVVTANELGIQDQIELIDPGVVLPIERHGKIAQDNPLGRIPTLVTDTGQSIYDLRVICEYLCSVAGNTTLYPAETDKRFRVLTLLALAQGICDTAVNLRYETFLRPHENQWDKWIARQETRLTDALNDLENNWHKDLETVTIGSIGVGAMLGYLDFRFDDMGWRTDRPKLAAFYDEFSKRPSMQATAIPAG